jgi:hypothetical protein
VSWGPAGSGHLWDHPLRYLYGHRGMPPNGVRPPMAHPAWPPLPPALGFAPGHAPGRRLVQSACHPCHEGRKVTSCAGQGGIRPSSKSLLGLGDVVVIALAPFAF